MTQDTTKPTIVEVDGGHWYDVTGNLVATVPSADGKKLVKCTLKHARKLDLARGVTSIMGCADKPALTRWKCEQVAIAACTLTRHEGETDESFQKRLLDEGAVIGKQSAEEGTRIHKAIQAHFQLAAVPADYLDHVDGAVQELDALCCDEWRSEVPCVSMLGYGTMADLVGYHGGKIVAVVDTKSKDGQREKLLALDLYDEHYMQLAATCHALGVAGVYTGILFSSRTHPGSSVLREVTTEQLARGLALFRPLLAYQQVKDNHWPSWAAQE
jgi:hypothetical protein